MTETIPPPRRPGPGLGKVFNLPNQLTSLRLVLSVVLFVLIAWQYYMTSLVLFILAGATDWLDGFCAGGTARSPRSGGSSTRSPTR